VIRAASDRHAATNLLGIARPLVDAEDHDAEDHHLVRAAQAGDQVALDHLLRRHYDRVYAVCRRMAGNEPDALDAAQEALLAIVRGLPRFDGRARFSTWAYRVATNACIDELRRRKRRPDPGLPEIETETNAGRPRLDDTVADRLDLDGAIAQLPIEFRAAVVLRDLVGMDYAEIAEVLGIPPGTVRSRIARGRAAVAARLSGNQPGPSDVQPRIP
jgi:RNA polymerase sigma-70 factor (ECF subfamily)